MGSRTASDARSRASLLSVKFVLWLGDLLTLCRACRSGRSGGQSRHDAGVGRPDRRRREISARRRRTVPGQGRHLRHLRARRRRLPVSRRFTQIAEDFRLMARPRHQHRSRLHAAAPRPARRGRTARAAGHGRAAVVAARRVPRRPDALRQTIQRDIVEHGPRARRSPGGADVRARQRDSAGRRALARHGSASSASCVDLYERGEGRRAGQPVHLRQLPADRVPRPVVLRRLRLQRLPAPRGRPARLPRAAAAHRRPQAAAAGRSGRRQHPRRRRRAGARSPRCTSARRSRKARAAPSRSPGPTSGGAADYDVEDWAFGLVDRQRAAEAGGGGRRRRRSPRRRFRRDERQTWPRVSVVVCAYNAADTLEDCLSSLERLTYPDFEVILVNDGSRDRTGEIARQHPRVRVIDIPNGGLSAARNVGLAQATRRDRRLHRRRHARRSRLADLSRSAVPHLGRRRLRRPERRARPTIRRWRSASRGRRAARRTCCSTIASPSTCPAATWRSAATRCSRSAASIPIYLRAGDDVDVCWRLQARGWQNRLRVVGARLAPPSLVGHGVLAAAGRLRRRRALADGAPSGEVPRRPHAVARPHLQSAAVRALALGRAHQRRRVGHGGVSVGLSHRRPPVRVPAAFGQLAGPLDRADRRRRGRRRASAGTRGRRRLLLGTGLVGIAAHDRRRTSPTRSARTSTR